MTESLENNHKENERIALDAEQSLLKLKLIIYIVDINWGNQKTIKRETWKAINFA